MNNKIFNIFFVALFFAFASLVNAQSKATKTKERMDVIKKMKLIDILGLDDDKAEKFFLKYNSYDKKIEENRKKMQIAMRELETAIAKNNSNEIVTKTNDLLNLQEELNKLTLEKLRGMKSVLSDIEYAKFVNFENKFVRELIDLFMSEKGKSHNTNKSNKPNKPNKPQFR